MSRALPVLLCLMPCMSAHAEAPARTHTARIGALEVTVIQETESRHTVALLKGIEPADAARLLGGETVFTSVNVFLVRMGSHLVLVDTGGSPEVNPSMGQVPARLKASLAPYQAAGVLKPFKPEEDPYPGVKALPTPGHTFGHTGYAFGSGKEVFWAVGDIVHFAKVQFPRPEVTVAFDTDGPKAAESRRVLLQQAAKAGAVLGGAHLPFPGLGRVEARSKAFECKPF